MYRYGESISAATFRGFKAAQMKRNPAFDADAVKVTGKNGARVAGDAEIQVDVMGLRNELAALQIQRIAVDVKTELGLGKLFSSTAREIQLASDLLDKVKQDQMDMGTLPKIDEKAELKVTVNDLPAAVAPKHNTLGEALGLTGATPQNLTELAKTLGAIVPINRVREK